MQLSKALTVCTAYRGACQDSKVQELFLEVPLFNSISRAVADLPRDGGMTSGEQCEAAKLPRCIQQCPQLQLQAMSSRDIFSGLHPTRQGLAYKRPGA